MAVAIHFLGDTFLRLSGRRGVPGRRQVLVHVRLSEFYDRFDEISFYSAMNFFRFHLGQLSLPQALPGIVSLVASSHLDAERRQLCEGRLLRLSLQAAAETATSGSDLELVFDIGTFCSPQAVDLNLMAHWMLETPLGVAVEEDILDYYYTEDSDGFGGIRPANRTFINNLESSPYGRGEGIRETQCMICLENFDVEAEVSKMPCSHTFHNQCIVHWLMESNVCPICRNKMATSSS